MGDIQALRLPCWALCAALCSQRCLPLPADWAPYLQRFGYRPLGSEGPDPTGHESPRRGGAWLEHSYRRALVRGAQVRHRPDRLGVPARRVQGAGDKGRRGGPAPVPADGRDACRVPPARHAAARGLRRRATAARQLPSRGARPAPCRAHRPAPARAQTSWPAHGRPGPSTTSQPRRSCPPARRSRRPSRSRTQSACQRMPQYLRLPEARGPSRRASPCQAGRVCQAAR